MRNGALTSCRDSRVAHDQLAQPILGIADRAYRHHHLVAHTVEAERHDLEEERLFAVEVVIEARLRQSERARDIADRRRIESPVAKDLRGGAADLRAARVEPRHRRGAARGHSSKWLMADG